MTEQALSRVALPAHIEIVEVGPRDGLQNETFIMSTAQKVDMISRAIAAGARRLEVASFVRADRVPQMADAEAVIASLPNLPDTIYIGLVLNEKGALRALETPIHELGAVAVASDSFAMKNQGQTADQSLDIACRIVSLAQQAKRRGQITISAAFGCPFEGEVSPEKVISMAKRAAASGAREVALADTIGVAVPAQVSRLVAQVAEAIAPVPVRIHLHNTRNTAVANVWAAVQAGATVVDASLGGLGGCPFAPRATGNVATEDVVYMLERSGVATGMDLARVIETVDWIKRLMNRELPGMVSRAGIFPPATLKS
jgi:hydroxymethylglutaryl-CoA lyase